MNKALKAVVGAAMAAGFVLAGTQAASAVPAHVDSDIGTYTKHEMINKTSKSGHGSQKLTYCVVARDNATCSVAKTTTATRSIAVDLGFSRAEVAGKLNVSASNSVSVQVSCTSPKLKKGEHWTAYPTGKTYSYKLRSTTYRDTGVVISGPTTSKTLKAFSPDGGIYCK